LEEALSGHTVPRYNKKLLKEYENHLVTHRNDVITAFLVLLADKGVFVPKSTLPRQVYARAQSIRWPTHDQHLLAAAIDEEGTRILVTETALANCARAAKREFGVVVIEL
jgi:hypothetical protein